MPIIEDMKTQGPPRITIPKGALIDGQDPETGFRYYYSEEDRKARSLTCTEAPKTRGFRGWISKNRGLAITLLDVFLLVILVIIFQTVLRPNLSAHNFKALPLRIEVSATRSGSQIAGSIEIFNKDEHYIPPAEGARIAFLLLESKGVSLNRATIRNAVANFESEQIIVQNSESIFGVPAVSSEFFFDLLPQGGKKMTYSTLLETRGREVDSLWALVSIPGAGHGVVMVTLDGN